MTEPPTINGLSTPLSLQRLLEGWLNAYCPACGRGGNTVPAVAWTSLKKTKTHNRRDPKHHHSHSHQREDSLPRKRTVLQSSSSSSSSSSALALLSHQAPNLSESTMQQLTKEEKLRAFLNHPSDPGKQKPLFEQYQQRKSDSKKVQEYEEDIAPAAEEDEFDDEL